MNVVQLDLWHLITLLLAFFGAVAGFGKLLLGQVEKRLVERFAAQDAAREVTQKHWDDQFDKLERASKEESGHWLQIDRDLMRLKADLPVQYVRREDYVRNQTVLEAKLDAVAVRIENIQLRSNNA